MPSLALGVDAEILWVHSAELEKDKGWEDAAGGRWHRSCRADFGSRGHRGQDRRRALRPDREGALPRAVPGHAGDVRRVRPARSSSRGRQLDRIRPDDAAPGDRPAAGAARHRRHGRDDAAGLYPCQLSRGRVRRRLRAADGRGAPPPPIRVQQQLPRRAGREGVGLLRSLTGRPAGGDRRNRRSSVHGRQPVPSRVPLAAEPPHPLFRAFVEAVAERAGVSTTSAPPGVSTSGS